MPQPHSCCPSMLLSLLFTHLWCGCSDSTHPFTPGLTQDYLEHVLQLFRELQDADTQRAVINVDDEAAPDVLQAASAVPCLTYGIDNANADVRVESLQLSLWRTTVRVQQGWVVVCGADRQSGHGSKGLGTMSSAFVWLARILTMLLPRG